MADVDGLNLLRLDTLKGNIHFQSFEVDSLGCLALNDPLSFLSLRSIVLSDVPLCDDDLMCLRSLQSLESLFLDDTQIGDIAYVTRTNVSACSPDAVNRVMHLIGLRRTLSHLELSWNDRITDDAIPTLCQILCLSFLSLKGTRVTMNGLRKLACHAKNSDKKTSVIFPSECEEYVCSESFCAPQHQHCNMRSRSTQRI